LSDNLALSDTTAKTLLKTLLDEANISDDIAANLVSNVVNFISSMISGSSSPFGMKAGSGDVQQKTTDAVDPQGKRTGWTGLRK
jgi:hypothetical protein